MTLAKRRFIATVAAFALASTACTVQAQVFFDSNQGGNFFADLGETPEGVELDAFPDTIYNGDNGGTGTRRADAQGTFFFANILFEGTAFGGIDQIGGNGNPSHLTNNASTNTATFFANNGSVVGLPDGASDETDDILPSDPFDQSFNLGDTINFSFDVITNGTGSPGDSAFDLSLIFDGGDPVSISSGIIPDSTGTLEVTNITGSFVVLEPATSFNVVSTLTNPGTGNDQIGLDNIELSLGTSVVVGDVIQDGVLDVLDFNAIRDNLFNTGAADGSLAGEAIGAVDGVVDLEDFTTFRTAFLAAGGSEAAFAAFSVPEPSTAVVLVCGLLIGGCRRSRVR